MTYFFETISMHDMGHAVIHKPRGQILNIFNSPPPLWTFLLNKAFVEIWTFVRPPTLLWFMNAPYRKIKEIACVLFYRTQVTSQDPEKSNFIEFC